ncbi:MAG: VWA domain-containing protein [Azospirillum sp.]|nr:VWA domain-containing protein [Azospirillum sp.]
MVSAETGRFAVNIMHFARTLRAAGLPVGTGRILQALEAVEAVGVGDRGDFYWALHAVFVNRRDQRLLFDQAFHVFWRNPQILERMMSLLLPSVRAELKRQGPELARRLEDALNLGRRPRDDDRAREREPERIEIDATLTWSGRELLQGRDFEKMSAEEVALAKAALRTIRLPRWEQPTRRFRADPAGRSIDLRLTMRRSLRSGGDLIELATRSRRSRPPPLVAICDISGSMDRYARMLLHFLHAVTNDRDRVYSFLFGTRLTNITRHLRHKDVDVALEKVTGAVQDWSGGTRIGACLEDFNRQWARRVLGQNAVVLLITDGLDRDAGAGLAQQTERLHKSCHRLIWLNPLLRFDGFAPKSLGIRAILPHVDDFRPVHSLDSLTALGRALDDRGWRRQGGRPLWREERA